MNRILLLLFIISFFTAQSQEKRPLQAMRSAARSNAANDRIGCSLFNDPANYTTSSSFTFTAPTNNNSFLTGPSNASYGCMGSVPNQAWFIITVTSGGNLYFNFSNSNNYDVDAVVWGPIAGNDVNNACASVANYPLTCDYDAARPDLYINNAQVGEKYVMLITNYSNGNTQINVSQPTGGSVSYSMVNLPNCSSLPSATLSLTGASTVTEGNSSTIQIAFTGQGPWTYTLSDGQTGTTSTSPLNLTVFPAVNTVYTVTSVSNICGSGSTSGSAGVSVTRSLNLKSCFPFDGNANDSQNLNNGTAQSGAILTTDRNAISNKAYQFDGTSNSYINFTGNQLNNNTFTYAAWVKIDELPGSGERMIMSVGASSNEHYLSVEYNNGIPQWKFFSAGVAVYSTTSLNTTAWHSVVGVRSGNALKLYIDGDLVGTSTVVGSATYGSPLNGKIGAGVGNDKRFKGKIDDVKIFSGSMIEPEILLLQTYNNCTNPYSDSYISLQSISRATICSGQSFIVRAITNNLSIDPNAQFVAELSDANGSFANPLTIGSSNFLPINTVTIPSNIMQGNYKVRINYGGQISVNSYPIFVNNPATATIAGTVALLDGQSTNLTLTFTGTAPYSYVLNNGLTNTTSTNPLSITVTPDQKTVYAISSASNVCGTATTSGSAVVDVTFTKQFVTCLPFNGDAVDSKGNNTTTLSNSPLLTENRYGNPNSAYGFSVDNSSLNSYMDFTTNNLRKRELSFSAWVLIPNTQLPAYGTTGYVISTGDVIANNFQGLGIMNSGGTYYWVFNSYTSAGQYSAYSASNIATETWTHITAVREYDYLKLYVNGNLVAQTFNNSFIPFKPDDKGRIGAGSGLNVGNYFKGKIDDVRLYKGALTADEAYALFANFNDCPTVENAQIIVVRSLSPTTVCAGNNVSVVFTTSNITPSGGGVYQVQLSSSTGSFANPIIIGSGTSSPISTTIPAITANGNYKIRIVYTGSPTITSINSSNIIVSGALPTATISGGGSIAFGGNATLTINFTGTAPFTYALNNGVSQTTSTNPLSFSVSPFSTTTYTVTSVSNTCGNGTGSGSATVIVAPNISLGSLGSVSFCQGQTFNVPFTPNFTPTPNFRVELSDAAGSFGSLTNIGTGMSSPISVTIPNNIPFGTAYKIRIVTTSPAYTSAEITGLTINAKATATISGTATINEGQPTNLTINFTGNSPWTYVINNGSSQSTSTNPLTISVTPIVNTTYTITSLSNICGSVAGSGSAVVSVTPVPIRLVSCFPFNGNANDSKGLNNGTVYGGATLTTDRFGNVNSAYEFDGNDDRIQISTNGLTNPNHTFSLWFSSSTPFIGYLLSIGGNNSSNTLYYYNNSSSINYISDRSVFSTNNLGITLNRWYHLVLVRNGVNITIYLNGNPVLTANGGTNAHFNGSLSAFIGAAFWDFDYFKGKIDDVQIYKGALTGVQVAYIYNSQVDCSDPTIISILALNTLQSTRYCQSQSFTIPFSSSKITPTVGSPINVELSDANGSFASPTIIGTTTSTSGNINVQIPANQAAGTGYKIRLKQGSNVSNLSAMLSINSPISATISGSNLINQGQSTNLTINFTGTAPFTYALNNGVSQTTSTNPLSFSVSPFSTTTYTLTSVSNTCGNGTGSGSATVIVAPNISLGSLGSVSFCQGQTFNVPFTRNFTPTPNFRVELSDAAGSFGSPTNIGTGMSSPISVTIPNNIPFGTAYKIRIVSDSPVYTSAEISGLTINLKATATISGTATINEGQSTNLTISFTGNAPWTYAINNGSSQTISTNPLTVSVSPLVNTTYRVTSISNSSCGNGTSNGSAVITANPVQIRLVSCFPFNGNANDSKGLNNGTVYGATLTTDRFGNPNSAYSFDGINDKIETGVNSFGNNNYSISVWFNRNGGGANSSSIYYLGNPNTPENFIYVEGSQIVYLSAGGYYYQNNLINNNQWYNAVLIRDGLRIKAYLNGVYIGMSEFDNTFLLSDFVVSILGANGRSTYPVTYFQGKIDDVQIYKGALTAGQVQALYQNQSACFDATTYTCLSNATYSSMLNGQQTLQVSNQIIGSSTIQTGSNIYFDSKNSVMLQPGFKTEGNAVFKATVGGGCN